MHSAPASPKGGKLLVVFNGGAEDEHHEFPGVAVVAAIAVAITVANGVSPLEFDGTKNELAAGFVASALNEDSLYDAISLASPTSFEHNIGAASVCCRVCFLLKAVIAVFLLPFEKPCNG